LKKKLKNLFFPEYQKVIKEMSFEADKPESWRQTSILQEVKFKAALSGGKGGQNVNKVNTKVELYWTPSSSFVLTEEQKVKVISRLSNKLNKDGQIRIVAEEERSQLKNKQKAIEKFYKILSDSFKEKKKRKATKPSKASVKKRIENKLKRKDVKQGRKKPDY
jgi:ribosome-associated protein